MRGIATDIRKSSDLCEVCGNHLYYLPIKPDKKECLVCGRKRLEQNDKEIEYRGGELAEKYGTYDALAKQSIVTDGTIKRATFSNFLTNEPESLKNLELAKQIAADYLSGQVFNCFLNGKPGTGKSHLSMSILKAINEASYPYVKCVFVDFPSLMIEVADWKNPNNYTQTDAIQLMSKADYLVIDDLGAETNEVSGSKEYVYKTLQAVTQNRQNKPTIFTSNISSKQIEQLYGGRLTSRILRGVAGHSIIFKDSTDKRRLGIGF